MECSNLSPEEIKKIKSQFGSINYLEKNKEDILLWAANNEHLQIINYLIKDKIIITPQNVSQLMNSVFGNKLLTKLLINYIVKELYYECTDALFEYLIKTSDRENIQYALINLSPERDSEFIRIAKLSIKIPNQNNDNINILAKYKDKSQLNRIVASSYLSAVGDCIGYRNGIWEFNKDGVDIHKQVERLGGIEELKVDKNSFIVSDDTVLHLATIETLNKLYKSNEELCYNMTIAYIDAMSYMDRRAPGKTTINSLAYIKKHRLFKPITDCYPQYDKSAGGCGAAMRTHSIGLKYSNPADLNELIAIAVKSSCITHNNANAILGGVCAAVFTSYAIQEINPATWGKKLLTEIIPIVKDYINLDQSFKDLKYFEDTWTTYLKNRDLLYSIVPKFPDNYGPKERDIYYKSISYNGWGGASGHDSTIIAYDALLASNGDWNKFVAHGVLHGGDNDSTGAIGGAWFGALYGFANVSLNHVVNLEYADRLEISAINLYKSLVNSNLMKKKID
jgi:ADP-ribosylarginine hydrolase